MLSRRNVRVKVMQMLYALGRDNKAGLNEIVNRYQFTVAKSFELYLFSLLVLMRVAGHARQDAAQKAGKLRPSEEDRSFTSKLADNKVIGALEQNEGLQQLFRKHKLTHRADLDNIRLFYNDFARTDEYKDYLRKAKCTDEDHRDILLALYKHLINSEGFEDFIEDNYSNWIDDKSLIVGAIKKTVKAMPGTEDAFYDEFRPAAEAVDEFGEKLLRRVCENDEELLALIEPSLRNWDAERVAVIDMILIKMALCEMMIFPSIPTKVTLNEFVEISKLYSTDKSKEFINGILDRLMKQLYKEGKIQKEGRGLQE